MTHIHIHDQFFNHKTSIERPFLYEQSGLSPQGAVVLVSERRVVFQTHELFLFYIFRKIDRSFSTPAYYLHSTCFE